MLVGMGPDFCNSWSSSSSSSSAAAAAALRGVVLLDLLGDGTLGLYDPLDDLLHESCLSKGERIEARPSQSKSRRR